MDATRLVFDRRSKTIKASRECTGTTHRYPEYCTSREKGYTKHQCRQDPSAGEASAKKSAGDRVKLTVSQATQDRPESLPLIAATEMPATSCPPALQVLTAETSTAI